MLIRTEDGIVRIFKDAPPAWANCGFTKLRTEGAFLVEAKRAMYHTVYVTVYSEKGGRIIIDTDMGPEELHGNVTYEKRALCGRYESRRTGNLLPGSRKKLDIYSGNRSALGRIIFGE